MSAELTFLNIISQNKNDFEKQKIELNSNKDLINKPFEDSDQGKTLHSPLTYCIENNLERMCFFLIENGADVNYKIPLIEDYPIHLACRHRSTEIVKKLLGRKDININSLNRKNETCFSIAMNNSDVSIYSMLIEYINLKKRKTETHKIIVTHNNIICNINNNVEDSNTTSSSIINKSTSNNEIIRTKYDENNNLNKARNDSEKMNIRINNSKNNKIMQKTLINSLEVDVSFKYENKYMTGKLGKSVFYIFFIYIYRLLLSRRQE